MGEASSSQLRSVTDSTWKSMAFVTEFLVALGLVTSVVHASPLVATTSAAATDCRAFTVNRCNFDKNGLISTTFDEDDSFCTFLCQVGMADTCKYFVYDYPNKQCDLYGVQADTDFSSYCDEEGGPALPVLANCAPTKEKSSRHIPVLPARVFVSRLAAWLLTASTTFTKLMEKSASFWGMTRGPVIWS